MNPECPLKPQDSSLGPRVSASGLRLERKDSGFGIQDSGGRAGFAKSYEPAAFRGSIYASAKTAPTGRDSIAQGALALGTLPQKKPKSPNGARFQNAVGQSRCRNRWPTSCCTSNRGGIPRGYLTKCASPESRPVGACRSFSAFTQGLAPWAIESRPVGAEARLREAPRNRVR